MRRLSKFIAPTAAAASLLVLGGCGLGISVTQVTPNKGQPSAMASNAGSSLFTFGKGTPTTNNPTQIQVNAYLWRAALNTLAFMPLVSADPFGGVIITDWYVPPATPDERFKVNAYILGQQLTANAIQVSVFHQIQQDGQWVDAPADPSVASGLEDRILADAANLQAEAQNTKD